MGTASWVAIVHVCGRFAVMRVHLCVAGHHLGTRVANCDATRKDFGCSGLQFEILGNLMVRSRFATKVCWVCRDYDC